MKFQILENSTEPSSRCGSINVSYDLLVKTFGDPQLYSTQPGHKVDINWIVQFGDGTLAIIYNYKNGPNYLGEYGTPVTEITNWHINGVNSRCVRLVEQTIAEKECNQLDIFEHLS
jgi:hypothetical protein